MLKIGKQWRKLIVFGVVLSMLIGVVFVNAAAEEKVTLDYWEHQYPGIVEWTKKMIKEYEAIHPNVNVEFTIDYMHRRILPAMFVGKGPDAASPHGPKMYKLMVMGYLAPVDLNAFPEFDSYEEMKQAWFKGALDPFTKDGAIYGIPNEYPVGGLQVNKKLFRKAGIDPEKNRPRTWDEVGIIGGKIFKTGKEGGQINYEGFDWGFYHSSWERVQIRTIFAQYGAAFVNGEGEAVVDTPQAIEAFQMMKDMIYKYKTGDPNVVVGADNAGWQFAYGNLAMHTGIGGPFQKLMIEPGKVDLLALPYPHPKGREPVLRTRTHGWIVNKNISERRIHEAWKFINFLTKQWKYDLRLMLNSPRIFIPGLDKPWYETDWFKKKMEEEPLYKGIPYDDLREGRGIWVALSKELYGTDEAVLRSDEITDVVVEAYEKMIFKDIEAEKVLDEAKKRLQQLGFK